MRRIQTTTAITALTGLLLRYSLTTPGAKLVMSGTTTSLEWTWTMDQLLIFAGETFDPHRTADNRPV
nr:hypothetical protein [Halapricum salinum]